MNVFKFQKHSTNLVKKSDICTGLGLAGAEGGEVTGRVRKTRYPHKPVVKLGEAEI